MEQNIRAGLGQALHVERRLLLPDAETHAQALLAYLHAGGGITNLDVAGSFRRRRETIGDLDVLATAAHSANVIERFVAYPEVAKVVSRGETRVTVELRGGLQVDLRVVEPAAYGAALLYFTGSKAHNVELRQIAQDHQYKLNEYGLYRGTRRVAGKTEEEVYAKLGLDWIPPELREARGEIARGPRAPPADARHAGARSAAISRCTPPRATAKPRSPRWRRRAGRAGTRTAPSPTTRSA